MTQIAADFPNVPAETLYDVLHDPDYRKSWDPLVIDHKLICRVSSNSDIGYYASKCTKSSFVNAKRLN